MFLVIKDFPILNRVANSQRRVKISFTEQELFCIASLLAEARDRILGSAEREVAQDLVNQICERLNVLNPGFLQSLLAAQRIIQDKGRDHARKIAQRMKERDRQNQHRKPC